MLVKDFLKYFMYDGIIYLNDELYGTKQDLIDSELILDYAETDDDILYIYVHE